MLKPLQDPLKVIGLVHGSDKHDLTVEKSPPRVKRASAQSFIVLGFEDSHASHYTTAFPLLRARGWPGVLFVITGLIDTPARLTTAQLREMRDNGWEIASHSDTVAVFNTLSRTEIETAVRTAKEWIEKNVESPCYTFAYPANIDSDEFGVEVDSIVERYHDYRCNWTAPDAGPYWNGLPGTRLLPIRRKEATNANFTNVPTWIANAAARNETLILYVHDIGVQISLANYTTVLGYVAASGLPVKTIRDVGILFSHPLRRLPRPERHLYKRYLSFANTPVALAAGPASSAFGTAGRVYLVPVDIPYTCTIDQIIYGVGTVAAGNVRLGIFNEGPTADLPDGGAVVVESASVAQAGANQPQPVAIANTQLEAGQYFVGLQGDDVTGTFFRMFDGSNIYQRRYDQVYGAFTTPCPATFAQGWHALVSLRVRSVP